MTQHHPQRTLAFLLVSARELVVTGYSARGTLPSDCDWSPALQMSTADKNCCPRLINNLVFRGQSLRECEDVIIHHGRKQG